MSNLPLHCLQKYIFSDTVYKSLQSCIIYGLAFRFKCLPNKYEIFIYFFYTFLLGFKRSVQQITYLRMQPLQLQKTKG